MRRKTQSRMPDTTDNQVCESEAAHIPNYKTNNYTYIVECSDGKLYTGWTNCIERRIHAHNSGTASKFTRSRRPVKLKYLEISETKSDAMKREAAIKKLNRCQKEQLIMHGQLEKILAENQISI